MIQPRIQSIILHLDNLEALRCLPAASMGHIVLALMNYAACGEIPQFKNRALLAVFHLLRAALDRDVAKYQTRCSGGSAAKTVAADRTTASCDDCNAAPAPSVSPHTPLNNNNNNNNNNSLLLDDDSTRETKNYFEGEFGKEKEEAATIEENTKAAASETTAESTATATTQQTAQQASQQTGQQTGLQNAGLQNAAAEDLSFDRVYDLYDKRAGDSFFAQSVWNTLKDDERRAAIEYIKTYVKMRPNRQFRKKFINFLQQRTWETEPLTDYRRPCTAASAPAANGAPASGGYPGNTNHYSAPTNQYYHGRQHAKCESGKEYVQRLLAQYGLDYESLCGAG